MITMENREKFYQLADQLEAEDADRYDLIIRRLRNLDYDDFANERFATPKMQMIADFSDAGRVDIVEQIKNGDYDQ